MTRVSIGRDWETVSPEQERMVQVLGEVGVESFGWDIEHTLGAE